MKTLSALKGISPVEGETMRGGNGKRSGNGKKSGNGKRRSLDDDKYDDNNIKTSGPTSRMALPLYGGDAQGAERVYYIMYIAEQLKKRSVAEYLLYMWQVEDTLRAYGLDVERMAAEYVPQFGLDEEKSEALKGWYESLVEMMREEGVTERGHLQVNKNIIILLSDLHAQLLKSSKHPMYAAMYYKVLPYIVELRGKRRPSPQPSPVEGEGDHSERKSFGNKPEDQDREDLKGEIENCFDALYGVMLLRAQKKEVSVETGVAMEHIAKFVGMLSEYYKKEKEGELEL